MTTTTTTTMTEATGSGSEPELATFDRYRRDVPTSADANGDDGSGPLLDALGRAIAGRTTRVAIRGTSGTGRTRLIERARDAATQRSMRVLATHGRSVDADMPYAALLTLLHPVADRLGELPTAERDSLLAAIDLRDADVAVRAARTGLWRLLTRLSEERPLLVAVDDSDQIDAATLDVMSFALGRMDSQAIAVLVAVDGRHPGNPLEAIGDELVVLDGLDLEAVVAAVRDAVAVTDWVARRMASFAGGNSTVAIELVRSLSPDQRSGRVACPAVPTAPTELAIALAPELDRMTAAVRTAIAVLAADTTADAGVVRSAMRVLGLGDDAVAELERIGAVTITGTTVRARTPMLGVVAYDRLGAGERRTIHHALAAQMTAPEHALARAWQLTGGSDGPNDQVAAAMSAVGTAAARHGNLRRAAIAHQRAADFAESGPTRAAAVARALACWTAIGDPVPMRRLLAEGGDDDTTTHIARSAAVRWLDGDGAAVAELRRGAQRATDAERPLLDALFADAAMEAGRGRDALEVAARVAATQPSGAARDLAVALLVLGGRAAPADLGPLEPESGDVAREVVRARAIVRRAQAHLRFGDARSAELELGATTDGGPLLWDPAERTALRGRLVAFQGHPVTARQLLVTAIDELPQGAAIPRAVLGNALAEVTFLLGDGEAAMELLDELVPTFHRHAMARREASAQTTIGRIAWSVGETDVAVACLERARRIDPFAPGRRSRRPAHLTRSGRGRPRLAGPRRPPRPRRPGTDRHPAGPCQRGERRQRVHDAGGGSAGRSARGAGGRADDRPRRVAPPPRPLVRPLPGRRAGGAAADPGRGQGLDRSSGSPRTAGRPGQRRRAAGTGAPDRRRAPCRPRRQQGVDEQGGGRRALRQRQDHRLAPAAHLPEAVRAVTRRAGGPRQHRHERRLGRRFGAADRESARRPALIVPVRSTSKQQEGKCDSESTSEPRGPPLPSTPQQGAKRSSWPHIRSPRRPSWPAPMARSSSATPPSGAWRPIRPPVPASSSGASATARRTCCRGSRTAPRR